MLLNTAVDLGKGVLFFPILEKQSKRTALAYLGTMIVEAVLLVIGVLCLLLIVPLAQLSVDSGQANAAWAQVLGSLAIKSNGMIYQVAEMSLGFGCVFLCLQLLRARLIPRFLSIWGLIGYPLLMAGAIAEMFGAHIGLVFSIPGGLFELALVFWPIFNGFESGALRRRTEDLNQETSVSPAMG